MCGCAMVSTFLELSASLMPIFYSKNLIRHYKDIDMHIIPLIFAIKTRNLPPDTEEI